ncbi:Putative cytochrome c biogenesis protein, CcsB-like [Desulfonema limicola]|uniref:Cytochrome c biogenesis protein, CcsB-like n=2 Tax=Desulfonema limicola TaxID=45656 RepID=A0A975GES5_9BACT|nr:Putative cytochrome c biogenesis protein, CcsB-like [Desulfonema limicola]
MKGKNKMKTEDNSSNILNNIWDFFVSVRLTVVILLSLAVTSIIGTLIPQNESHEAYIRAYGESLYRILDTFDIFDMYRSWWFQLLIIMLAVNIIVCSIDRLSSLWKIIFVKNPSFKISTFKNLSNKEEFSPDIDGKNLKEKYKAYITKNFSYVKTEDTENGFYIFAEKGRWTRIGVYIVHLSILLLLLGSLIGSIFGFEGYVNIPEGESVNSIKLRNNGKMHPLDFEIRCDKFNVSFYDSGAPQEYRSSLVLLKDGKTLTKKDIIVNDPIRYSGINIFQSSYGSMPPDIKSMNKDGVAVSFTARESQVTYEKKVFPGKPVDLPEGMGTFVIKDFIHSYKFMGQRDLGNAFVGTLTETGKQASEIYLPVKFPNFDKMRGGDIIISITDHSQSQKYYTGLQVTHDPGVPLVYAGFIIMIIGCFVTFFMSHQKICVELNKNTDNTKVIVSGTCNKNKITMENDIKK